MAKEKPTVKDSKPPTYQVYDPEVEKLRIKSNEKIMNQVMNFLNTNIPNFMDYWKEGQKIDYHGAVTIPRMAILLVGVMLLVVSFLTYAGKVAGESLTFLRGIIVGYLLAIVKPEEEQR